MTDPTSTTEPKPAVAEASIDEVAVLKPNGVIALINRHMHYPNAYAWLLLLSAMDIMLTWTIFYFGGHEVNPIAKKVIDIWGLNGMIIYKFLLIMIFIGICEIVATLREPTGKMLSRISVMIAAFPVIWSLTLLARHTGLIS